MMAVRSPAVDKSLPLSACLVAMLMASSSYVLVEPAPYDLLAVALIAAFFLRGLRVPAGLGVPLFASALFAVANLVSILVRMLRDAEQFGPMTFYAAVTFYLFATSLFFACYIYQRPRTALRAIWTGYAVAATFAATLGIFGYFGVLPYSDVFVVFGGRAKGTFEDPNVYGPFLVPVLMYVTSSAVGRPPLAALVRYTLALYLALGLFLGFSRGSWANLAISTCIFALLYLSSRKSAQEVVSFLRRGAVVLVLLLVALVTITLTSPQVLDMLQRRATLFQKYDLKDGGRFDTQRIALRAVLDHPLGVGPQQRAEGQTLDPHNLYIKVAVENGWLGFVAFVWFIGSTLWRGLRFCSRCPGNDMSHLIVMSCLVAVSIQSLTIDTLHWRHLFLLVGMAWGMVLAGEKEFPGR